MNIPARYCTGYLGDIGVPFSPAPMDFSGWMEAYLGGQWHVFDPRHNARRIGRVLIAHGRDAADVALSMTFGPNTLASFKVWTDEVAGGLGRGAWRLQFKRRQLLLGESLNITSHTQQLGHAALQLLLASGPALLGDGAL